MKSAAKRRTAERTIPKVLSDLHPDPRNARTIDEIAKAGLAHSMDEFGDISGLVFNVRSGHLVCGHQRKDVLPPGSPIVDYKEMTDAAGTVGYGFVMVSNRRWPVRFVDWNDTKEKAANVTANNSHIGGTFTAEINALLQEIETEAPDLYDQTLMHKIYDDLEREGKEDASGEEVTGEYDLSPLPYESYHYVLLIFKNDIDWATAVDHFGVKKVRDPKNPSRIGMGQVIDGAKYLKEKLEHLWTPQKSKS